MVEEKKKIYCAHCGSYKGPFVYKRELGAYYCVGHAEAGALGAEPYQPVEKAWRTIYSRADGFVQAVEDSDKPHKGTFIITLDDFNTEWGGEVVVDTMSWSTGLDPKPE